MGDEASPISGHTGGYTKSFQCFLFVPKFLHATQKPKAQNPTKQKPRNHSSFFLSLKKLFLAALGLRCCAWAFSSCSERGLLFVVVRGLLIVVASLVTEHGL